MNIESEKAKTIYKSVKDDKEFYSIGLSKKKQDGTYEIGFIPCKFKKDTKIENKTKILIKQAWLDFFKKDKTTYPYIFINQYEEVQIEKPVNEFSAMNIKTEYEVKDNEIEITDEQLPF